MAAKSLDLRLPEALPSVAPEGEGESAAMALSGFIVQLDRSIRAPSSLREAKEVKAGNDAVDGLNKALFLPSLNTSRRGDTDDVLRKTDPQSQKGKKKKKSWITEGKTW